MKAYIIESKSAFGSTEYQGKNYWTKDYDDAFRHTTLAAAKWALDYGLDELRYMGDPGLYTLSIVEVDE